MMTKYKETARGGLAGRAGGEHRGMLRRLPMRTIAATERARRGLG